MLKFGILTAGNIAAQMAATIAGMPDEIEPYAIAARDAQRAAELAQRYGFAKSYGSYDALYADPDVDIIYIGSPHSHHYEHAKAALLAGKHVLCEKAMTTNAALAEELYALADEKHLLLCDATWTRYQPFVPVLQKLIADQVIGEVKMLNAGFGVANSQKPRIAQPELAGGALLDLGIYPLTFAAIALGTDVVDMKSTCVKSPLGVDAQDAIIVTYRDGTIATLQCTTLMTLPNEAVLSGTKGTIRVAKFWQPEQIVVEMNGEAPYTIFCPFDVSGYEYEVRSMVRAIAAGKTECPELPRSETLRILRVMDELRREWGVVYPFD